MTLSQRFVVVASALLTVVPAAVALDTIVVFNEVHYHPADDVDPSSEFIELFNQNSVNIDMSGWRLTGGVDYTFPEGTVIDGGGYLVVASEPAALGDAAGITGVLGPFTGALDNGGETIRLRNNNRRVMDELSYNDRAPWPVGADGSGATLSKLNPMRTGAVPEHWAHSLEIDGTPGAVNFASGGSTGGGGSNIALGKMVIDGSSAYNGQPFDQSNGAGQDFRAQNVNDGSVSDVFGSNYWLGNNDDPTQFFTLDLGQSYDITEIHLRNTHNAQFDDRGTLGFQVSASNSVNGSNQLIAPQLILSNTLATVNGQDPITAEVFTAANGLTEVTARYLRFNTFTAVNGDAGLNEIEVYTAGGVPTAVAQDLPLWVNEVAGTVGGSFWIELFNSGAETIDLEGFVLSFEDAGEYVFPSGQSIASGGWMVIDSATLGLPLAPIDGENLYFYQKAKTALLDAVRIDDLGIARVPDGGDEILGVGLPTELSPGAANTVTVPDSIVINEIMYHHRPQYAKAGDPPTITLTEVSGWNDVWRFNQEGDDLGSSWASSAHAVGGNWESGPGPFGYETSAGNPPEQIITSFRNPALNSPRVITFYLETEFDVPAADLPNVSSVRLTHAIDDGAIFYLNGQEVARYDMPDGAVSASTLAQNNTSSEASVNRTTEVSPSALVAGQNRISIEVHQSSTGSSDVVMALKVDLQQSIPGANPPTEFVENGEEWIELHNPTAAPVDIGGWELNRAVDYLFPAGTQIPAGGYLVVPDSLSDFTAKFPSVPAIGGYSGSLSNSGERLILRDTFNNTVDEVAYFDNKPWPAAADGGGSSLELRHPEIDNSIPASWAASDNSGSSAWRSYEYLLTALNPTYAPAQNGFHELRLGLLEAGEILIDDVSVVEDPGGANLELIANGSFANISGWRLLGTHQDSEVINDGGDNVLKVVASDRFSYLNNLLESNLTSGGSLRPVTNGTEYRVRFRAKWLSGSPQFRFELYYNKLAALIVLDQPIAHGTPGTQNSAYSTTLGPDLSGLIHSPAVPSTGDAVTVSVAAADPDGLGSLILRYAVNAGSFQSSGMSLGSDGRYSATIPSQSKGAKVQFYVQATDGSGNTAFAPPGGSDSRAIIEFDNTIGVAKQSIRINMLTAEANMMHEDDLLLDNQTKGCTIITDEEIIAYDGAMRLRGSMFSRRDEDTTGLNLKFPADRRFRDLHSSVHVKRGDRIEILAKHMINVAGNLHDSYNDIAWLDGHITAQNGAVRLEMARFGRNYLSGLPGGDGTDGTVFKMEGIRVFEETQDGTSNTPKVPFPIEWVPSFDLANQGDDQEIYRHNIRINSSLDRDDYSGAMAMCQLFSLNGQELEDAAPSVIDVDNWTRKFAMMSLCGITDAYSQGNPHNCNFYTAPDGLVDVIPWDWDHTFELPTTASLWGNRNVSKLFARPVFTRLYHGHLLDIIDTTFNSGYISEWADHLGDCAGENYSSSVSYITSRGNYVLSQLPAQVAFTVTTNGGSNFSTGESTVTLSGNGWIDVRELAIAGRPEPLDLTWTDGNSWQVEVPIAPGANVLSLTAINHQGVAVGTDTITVTNTSTVEPASSSNLVVSEIHYHPAINGDEEFIELLNIHPSANVDLSGVTFTDGIDFEFPAATVLAPGARLLVVRDLAAFTAANGNGLPVAGSFENLTGLSNGGETITLQAPGGIVIRSFTYDDKNPWPESPDGDGASLVLIDPTGNPEHQLASSWRPSTSAGGNPGGNDTTTFPGGDIIDYALSGGMPALAIEVGGDLILTYPRNLAADDIEYAVEISTDLLVWTDGSALFDYESMLDLGTGVAVMNFRSANSLGSANPRLFVRLLVTER